MFLTFVLLICSWIICQSHKLLLEPVSITQGWPCLLAEMTKCRSYKSPKLENGIRTKAHPSAHDTIVKVPPLALRIRIASHQSDFHTNHEYFTTNYIMIKKQIFRELLARYQ